MLTPLFPLLLGAGLALTDPAVPAARPHPVLLELFTSQGCSSCPAADTFVRELPRLGLGRDRVLPLTFHVDYWDDLGWKDPFASPRFTERQRAYAASGQLSSPAGEEGIHGSYTPQMIVAGRVHFSGSRRSVALAEIERASRLPEPATLAAQAVLDRNGAEAELTLRVSAGESPAVPRDWQLYVALAQKEARTAVRHGENAGETLAEAAVVRWLSAPIAIAGNPNPHRVTVPKPADVAWRELELVAFVQAGSTGQVVSARAVPLPNLPPARLP